VIGSGAVSATSRASFGLGIASHRYRRKDDIILSCFFFLSTHVLAELLRRERLQGLVVLGEDALPLQLRASPGNIFSSPRARELLERTEEQRLGANHLFDFRTRPHGEESLNPPVVLGRDALPASALQLVET
jgi:hypothetical protein